MINLQLNDQIDNNPYPDYKTNFYSNIKTYFPNQPDKQDYHQSGGKIIYWLKQIIQSFDANS